MVDISIINTKAVNENQIKDVDLYIENGRIKKISSGLPPLGKVIDAQGMLLFPGVIDDQVHFREPGLTNKGNINSESKAAVAGGTTSYMDMPNVLPPTLNHSELEKKNQIASKDSLANYSFYLGATNTNIEEIKSMITEKMQISLPDDKNQKALALIGNWSENYNSWKNFDLTEKIIIKYEDLVLNPFESFFKIIKYLNKLYNLVIDEKKIKKCIELTKFSKLQNLEKKFGFKETISKNELFFRTGKIGQWEKKLNKNDVIKIENTFKKEMVELGYL